MVQFLYDFKKGHCEYFAGAMTLMCQGLKMNARMVVGLQVRRLQQRRRLLPGEAEPRPRLGRGADAERLADVRPHRRPGERRPEQVAGVWKQFMNVLSYLEYTWGDKVVNYDSESRSNLIQNVDSGLTNTTVHASGWMQDLKQKFDLSNFFYVLSGQITLVIGAMFLAIVIALIYFLYERLRLRRRARRSGSICCPRATRCGSPPTRVLRRAAAKPRPPRRRPPPAPDADGVRPLDRLPARRFVRVDPAADEAVLQIRYGGRELDADQLKRLMRVVDRIDTALGPVRR
jgi:hypothetical protein